MQLRRRSFSQKTLETRGEGPLADLLAEALVVPEVDGYQLTHGFCPYPGRFHPRLVNLLIEQLTTPAQVVLDPFMGGGTTLVEGMLLGRRTIGSDLNPVGVLIARERTRPRMRREGELLIAEAHRIAAIVESLRKLRNPPRARHAGLPKLAPHYAPHLFAELVQWIRIIDGLPPGATRESLRAVFCAGVVKYSNRRSDSDSTPAPPKYPKGAVSRYFVRKTAELAEAQLQLGQQTPKGTPAPELFQEDARLLPSLGWECADWVLTSPPYPGVYDYHDQHRLRLDWLQLESAAFQAGEAGPRRDTGKGWSAAMRDVFGTLARVVHPRGNVLLVVGDWMYERHGVDAAAQTLRLAEAKGWHCASQAAARRPTHGRAERNAFKKRGKWEHLLHLRRR